MPYAAGAARTPVTRSAAPSKAGPPGAGRRPLAAGLLAAALCLAAAGAAADAFADASYDPVTDTLLVTLLYRGTNPVHRFTLQWGACTSRDANGVSHVAVEVLDSQWDDPALEDYSETVHLSLAGLPCRPAEVTLRTAPRFIYNVFVPAEQPEA